MQGNIGGAARRPSGSILCNGHAYKWLGLLVITDLKLRYSKLNLDFWEFTLKNEKWKWPVFAKFIDQSLISFFLFFFLSIITALQPWAMVAKDIFLFATMTDRCKKISFMEIFNQTYIFC